MDARGSGLPAVRGLIPHHVERRLDEHPHTDVDGALYNASYQLVTSDSSSGEDYNFRMAVSLTPGTYYLKIAHDFSSSTGPYSVHIEGPGAPTVTDDHGSSPWSATAVTVASTPDPPKCSGGQ